MKFSRCEMCKHCVVKINNDMSLTLSCLKGKHDIELRKVFNGEHECIFFEYLNMIEIYPLIFKNIKFD